MLRAMDIVRAMDEGTKVFCGHEYTLSNMKFCLQAESNNEDVKAFAAKY